MPERTKIAFQRLFQKAPSAFMVLDRELRFIAANDAYLAITATPSESQLLGRHILEAFPHDPNDPNNDNARQLRESLERVFATGKTDVLAHIVYKVPMTTPQGVIIKERTWSCTHTPLLDDDGSVIAVLQQTEDVTELEELRSQAPTATTAVPAAAASVMRRAEDVQAQNRVIDVERKMLRQLLEQAPVFACFLRGKNHMYELANAAYRQLIGHRDVVGKSVREALPELEGQGFYELLDRVFNTREPFVGRGVPVTLQTRAGGALEQRHLDFTYQPIVEQNGEVSGIFVIGRDVTEQFEAARARNKLAAIVEQSSDFIAAVGPTGQMDFINESGRALLGVGDRSLANLDPLEFFFPEDHPFIHGELTRSLTEKGHWHGEFRMRHTKTGEDIPVDYNVFLLKDADGQMAGAASVTRDLRERRALEQERLFLSDALPVHVWTADPKGVVTYVNQRMVTYFGASKEQLLKGGWPDYMHPDDSERSIARWVHCASTGEPYDVELRLRNAAGEYRWHVSRALPLRDERGAIAKWYGTNSDIHDRKSGAEEREQLIDALAASNRELDRFAYVASHDLKTPLRGIGNLAQWIEEDAAAVLSAQSKEHLELLRGRVARMDALIDGVLKYSRSLKADEHVQDVDVRDLVEVVVDLLALPPEAQVGVEGAMPIIRTAYVALQQVFLNLIGNAVKHAGRPGIRVVVTAREEGPYFEFSVRDNGPGISPEHHKRIWDLFQTLQGSQSGAGIGLSVVKRLVELRGGRVGVRPNPPELAPGSTFYFTWPKELAGSTPPRTFPAIK